MFHIEVILVADELKQFRIRVLSRASKPVIAGDAHLEEMRHGALAICDELDPQPIKAGKSGFRLRRKLYLLPSFEFAKQRSVRDCDFDNCGVRPVSPEVQFL